MDIHENIADIDIYFCETPDYAFSKTHFHNAHKIIYITEGVVKIDVADKSYTASADSIIFISNLEKHSVKILKAPYKRYVVSLPQDFGLTNLNHSPLLSILIHRPLNFSHAIGLSTAAANDIKKVLNELLKENNEKNSFWSERFLLLIVELLIRLYRYSSASFPVNETNDAIRIVTQIQQFIICNCQKEISLEAMAKEHFINKYYLSRIFKKITGYTFKDYTILQRLSVAKDLLLHTDLSVTEVCLQSGYNNINHFIRIFKTYEGITPYQFKKRHH